MTVRVWNAAGTRVNAGSMESSFSHERLLLGADVAVLVSGPHVQVLNVQ
jgi:hypothetical protein